MVANVAICRSFISKSSHFLPFHSIIFFLSWKVDFVYLATRFTHGKRLQCNPTFYSYFFFACIPRVSRRFSSKYCCYIDIFFLQKYSRLFYLAASNVCLYTLASNEEVQTAIYLSFDHAHRALKSTKKSNLRNHSAKSSAGSPRWRK